jgi:hypothetical protein
MTLLVGAMFPWRDLLDSPIFRALKQLSPAGGAIIAADSRWTYPDGRTEDGAVKMFGLGTNAIAAYAGSAIAGEDAIIGLSTKLKASPTVRDFTSQTQAIITSAWQDHDESHQDGLEILLAYSYPSGSTWLGHFSSADDFTPQEVDDTKVIGPQRAVTHFERRLREAVVQNLEAAKSQSVSLSIETWAAMIAAAINDACELRAHDTVGGRVICGYTMLGRPQGLGVTRVSPGPSGPVVDEIGLDHGEAKKVRTGWEYVPPADDRDH